MNRAGDVESDEDKHTVTAGNDESVNDSGSEVGWNSSDEYDFGRVVKKKDDEPMDEDDYDSEDGVADGGILLSDLIKSNKSENTKSRSKMSKDVTDYSDESDDQPEDEDIDDGEDIDDDEDNDDDDDTNHFKLLNAIGKFSDSTSKVIKKSGKSSLASQRIKESSYSSLLQKDGSGKTGEVTMDDLLGVVDDQSGLKVVKKKMTELQETLPAPVYTEKVIAERLERQKTYADEQKDMEKWQHAVVANRHMSTLDLANDKRELASYRNLVKKFVPTTSMEKEIEMILIKHNATDEAAEERELDELGHRDVSMEEMKERQKELAKVKALLFYQQMKNHRINKIKSKAYRSIRKKAKQRHQKEQDDQAISTGDADVAEELKEKTAFARVKERMDMRHKNTSKWAKMALTHGHVDQSLRAAYHESVQLGNELTQRINEDIGAKGQPDGSDCDLSDEENGKKVSFQAAKAIDKFLAGVDEDEDPEVDGKYQKLFDMDFMKRAISQQKEKAKKDAITVLREIEKMEEDELSDRDRDHVVLEREEIKLVAPEVRSEVENMFRTSATGMLINKKRNRSTFGEVSFPPSVEIEEVKQLQQQQPLDEEDNNPWLMPSHVDHSKRSRREEVDLVINKTSHVLKSKANNSKSDIVNQQLQKTGKENNSRNKESNTSNKSSTSEVSTGSKLSSSAVVEKSNVVESHPTKNVRAPLLSQRSQV